MDRNAITYLSELNKSMDGVFAMLEKLCDYPELQKNNFIVLKASLREELGNVNTNVLDALEDSEHKACFVAFQQRKEYEKAIRDPNDCYLMVMQREKELEEQGQASQIKVIFSVSERTRDEILSTDFAEDEESETGSTEFSAGSGGDHGR
jgi:hypothetical protein